jgi:hypothetical protein
MEKLGKHGGRELAQEVLVDGKMVAEAKVKTEGGVGGLRETTG